MAPVVPLATQTALARPGSTDEWRMEEERTPALPDVVPFEKPTFILEPAPEIRQKKQLEDLKDHDSPSDSKHTDCHLHHIEHDVRLGRPSR
ncbi:hypothetical protein BDV10DRAFT_177837 [Aspergillus recurvatus]